MGYGLQVGQTAVKEHRSLKMPIMVVCELGRQPQFVLMQYFQSTDTYSQHWHLLAQCVLMQYFQSTDTHSHQLTRTDTYSVFLVNLQEMLSRGTWKLGCLFHRRLAFLGNFGRLGVAWECLTALSNSWFLMHGYTQPKNWRCTSVLQISTPLS